MYLDGQIKVITSKQSGLLDRSNAAMRRDDDVAFLNFFCNNDNNLYSHGKIFSIIFTQCTHPVIHFDYHMVISDLMLNKSKLSCGQYKPLLKSISASIEFFLLLMTNKPNRLNLIAIA